MESIFGEKVISPLAMREAEQKLMAAGKASEDELISRAAKALAEAVKTRARKDTPIAIAAGRGNNGCDGLECALILVESGFTAVTVALSGDPNEGGRRRAETLRGLGVPVGRHLGACSVVVDSLLGTGLNRAPSVGELTLIEEIRGSGAFVISADVPSGLNAETGAVPGTCVKADETVSFGGIKSGLLMGEGRNFAGRIVAADIGVPVKESGRVTAPAEAELPARPPVSHKGSYGRVRVIGGSEEMPGAPLMCYESAMAALRSGAGLVTLCVPDCMKAAYMSRVKETTLRFLPSCGGGAGYDPKSIDEAVEGADAVAVGCGMGKGEAVAKIVERLAHTFRGTLVIDADAINAVAAHPYIIKDSTARLILTPHVGEFSRLVRSDPPHSAEAVRSFAAENKCVVAMKSATTVITDGERVRFNVTGTPAMAKGGSGDVLAGMIAAISCVLPPFEAAVAACFHFGLAGERAARHMNSETSVLASDIIIELSRA